MAEERRSPAAGCDRREVSGLALRGCRAGEPLELAVRLVATATRGSVAVDLFGFSAKGPDDLHRMFGLRPLAGEPLVR